MTDTRLVEVPWRTPAEDARLQALVRAEHKVLVLAMEWLDTWADRPNDVPPGADRKLYDALDELKRLREAR